ncbi:ROK family protein [Flavihumibacter rivuli]|uniref:ROK family protein n=1 Tax=Flavihumibacter rivuli TaxID=2838156 RepID=UPI001BDE4CD8|nr:ROK family protein [Flavihumibacter rivuli]ULQ56976.1 ROK family protein [Flavihumibacter rivuli]
MKKQLILTIDVGGTHVTTALIDLGERSVVEGSLAREYFDSNLPKDTVLQHWLNAINHAMAWSGDHELEGVGICMPGPFDYQQGICWIKDQDKYEHFYGVNIREELRNLLGFSLSFPILFENDAACFGKGEVLRLPALQRQRVIAMTLGTGLGGCFIENGLVLTDDPRVTKGGELYYLPYRDGIAEDYISTRALVNAYHQLTGIQLPNAKEIADRARSGDKAALECFHQMGIAIGEVLRPWINSFRPASLVLGGKISISADLFLLSLQQELKKAEVVPDVLVSIDNELAALFGAAALFVDLERVA